MTIEEIRRIYKSSKVKWSQHCLQRMGERDISIDDVSSCIDTGEIIEDYPDDYPHPSCLILGFRLNNKGLLHIVVGTDGDFLYMITAYIPSEKWFDADGRKRKER